MNLKSILFGTLLLAGTQLPALAAEQSCSMPKPGPEHAWLQQEVGEWVSTTEMMTAPGQPPQKSAGTESIKPLGSFWTINEVKGEMMQSPFTGNMTLGYDTEKKQYVGTWVDSMTGKLWVYHGNLDKSKKALELISEGICPMHPGKMTQFREVIEHTDKNHKRFTSAMLGEDGKWVTMMTSVAERKAK